ncbi:uncharacterized protein MONBRDRAFT_23669 [Monosiga brevicollis MX1]|uniref:Myosin motor domain-containing protein n=1 Tax=Monosiga brevicollis TaxID=81824 RepID=A9UU44_MONBE|nr:uncharacterized protein MONBRDRAFT_23669 [Monosiga brevicollis MX1]EDQ91357.1 predicted protein [Monosiga brevicollis MX1]|eukprot:XP_001743779.1 hypothetical protein [Monosiga brevicollis MX1]
MPGSKARSMVKPPVRPRVRREPLKERHTPQTSNVVSPATPERCPRPASHDATPARVQANAWKEQDLTRVAPRHMNNSPTVIAINPYKADKADDSDANRQLQYAQASSLDTVPVHLYTVSERAVRQLQASHARQAIILSGQSGAGKTYSVSRLVTYIAQRLSGDFTKNGADANVSTIQDQVAATGPIFQAFGNARTVNNPNSSRFGKYLRLHCNDQTQVSSASIEVYLLETSRVVHQQTGEHNFHCFHQLRSAYEQGLAPWGSDVVSKADADAIWSQQTIVPPTHPASEASAAGWAELTAALGCVGFGSTEVHRVAQAQKQCKLSLPTHFALTFTLHGCIRLATLEAPVDARFVQLAAKLLQIDAHQLSIYIYHHAMIVRGDSFVSPRTVAEARVVISSLQTQLYQLLFSFITDRLNSTLRPAHAAAEEATSIDLLDIFGFERCQTNGFDQLCINLANEQLQEHYLHQLVENQAQILRDEGICELPAQLKQETCMALLAGRGGILDLLDEDSRLKRVAATSNEAAFAERLRGLAGPWLQEDRSRDGTFAVRHYAGRVHYDVLDMPAQNKAKPYQGLVDLLASTRCSLMQAIMQHAPTSKVGQRRVDTVSSAYKKSLRQLFEHLSSVQSHYLRCMSSNDACAAWHFEPETVRTQLEAAGVPQSLEVFAHGRPVMCTLQQLQARLPVLIRPVPCNLQEAAARLQAQLGRWHYYSTDGALSTVSNAKGALQKLSAWQRPSRLQKLSAWQRPSLQKPSACTHKQLQRSLSTSLRAQ